MNVFKFLDLVGVVGHVEMIILKKKARSFFLLVAKAHALLEICHFATVLCNWFLVACDTCN